MPSSTHLPLSPISGDGDDPPELEYSSPIMHQHPPPSQHRLSDTDDDDADNDIDSMHDGEQPLSRSRQQRRNPHPSDPRRVGVPERYQRIDSSSSAAVQPAASSLPIAQVDDHMYSHDADVEMDEKTEEKKVDHSRRATLRPLRPFYVNEWLDVKDTQDSWLEAQVIQLDSAPVLRANDDSAVTTTTITSAAASASSSSSSAPAARQIRIHYKGFRNIYDEWLDVSHDQTKDIIERIAPLHTHTEVPNPIVWPRPFSSVGDKVDCKDKLGTWLPASIATIDEQHLQVEIKYDNWNEKHNEWLNADSYRIQPLGAFTQAPITAVKPRGVGGGRVVGVVPVRGQAAAGVSTHSAAVSAEKIAQFQASQTNELRFRNILGEKLGYEIVDQKEDGNCLFRSVSHQVYGDPVHHRLVRLFTLKYIESEKYFFQNYIAGETFEQYILRMRNDGEWGDNLEIQAISEIYDRPIEIYAYSHKPLKTFTSSSSSSHSAANAPKPIRLSYHFASHYNSVINRSTHLQTCLSTAPGIVEEEALQRVARLRREFQLQRQALTAAAANVASSSNASPEIPSSLVSSRATFSSSQSRLQANPFDFENAVASSLSEMDATYEATLAQAQQESAREHDEAQLLAAVAKQSEAEAIEQHLAAAAASSAASSSSSAVPSLASSKSTIEEDNLNRALAASLAGVPSAQNEDDELAAALRESAAAAHRSPAAISMSSDDDLQRALQSSLAERENQLPSAVRSCVNLGFSLDQAITAWTVVGDPATASGASEEIVVQRMMDFMLSN